MVLIRPAIHSARMKTSETRGGNVRSTTTRVTTRRDGQRLETTEANLHILREERCEPAHGLAREIKLSERNARAMPGQASS